MVFCILEFCSDISVCRANRERELGITGVTSGTGSLGRQVSGILTCISTTRHPYGSKSLSISDFYLNNFLVIHNILNHPQSPGFS